MSAMAPEVQQCTSRAVVLLSNGVESHAVHFVHKQDRGGNKFQLFVVTKAFSFFRGKNLLVIMKLMRSF